MKVILNLGDLHELIIWNEKVNAVGTRGRRHLRISQSSKNRFMCCLDKLIAQNKVVARKSPFNNSYRYEVLD